MPAWLKVLLGGVKALPSIVRALRGKPEPLDPALGESEAAKVVREADAARNARKR